MNFRILFLLIMLQLGCQNFQRSDQSGYGQQSSRSRSQVVSSSDINGQRKEPVYQSEKDRIAFLEKNLKSKSEKEHYTRILPWFESQDERLEYLLMNSLDKKETWAKDRNIWQRSSSPSNKTLELVQNQDIAIGMPREFVRKSWGEPQSIDVSGDPHFLNERWKYTRYASSSQGYKQEKKYVYFEGGKVVGWSTD